MSTLADYIKSQPPKSLALWARDMGISRPYLYGLMDGTRYPGPEVAVRIAQATGGAVPVEAWPNHAVIVQAARQGAA
jgi:DNA-binding transcriptional regulator YdaS (Cro superfamily)